MEPDDLTHPADSALMRRVRSALDRRPADPDPEAAQHRARMLLNEILGAEAETAAFAPGYVPLSGEHTDYFDGLALLLRLPGGVAVAAARAPGASRLVVQFGDARPAERPVEVQEEEGTLASLARLVGLLDREWGASDTDAGVVVAMHSALPVGCSEALLGAAAAAVGRALAAAAGRAASEEDVVRAGAEAVGEVLARPFGPALLVAARQNVPLVLVDTATHEAEALASEPMGWGLLDTGHARKPPAARSRHRLDVLRAAVDELRHGGFEGLRSLRGLEHHDLPRALDVLHGEAKHVVRYLATEDRRVQRLLVALRKGDGQVVGAHLLMSQAALRDDWQASTPEAEFVVREAEAAEGIYGVRMVGGGFGGCVLVVGRPFLVPPFLDALAARFEEQFGVRPGTAVL